MQTNLVNQAFKLFGGKTLYEKCKLFANDVILLDSFIEKVQNRIPLGHPETELKSLLEHNVLSKTRFEFMEHCFKESVKNVDDLYNIFTSIDSKHSFEV